MNEVTVEIPDELFDAMAKESEAFEQNEGDRNALKDAIRQDVKDFKKERKDAKVDTSVSASEKNRYKEIGEAILSAGQSVVQKISKKEAFKSSLSYVISFIKSPVKLAKGAIDFVKKTPIFKIVAKISAVLLLGYGIFSGFFDEFGNSMKNFLSGSFSFVENTILPFINEAFNFTVTGVGKITNFVVNVATGNTMKKVGRAIEKGLSKMMMSLTNHFFGGADSSKPNTPEAFGTLALESRIRAAEEEATAELQTDSQKNAAAVAKQLKTGSSFHNLIVEFTSKDEFDKKVKQVGNFITANDSDIISVEEPEDMAQSALELMSVLKNGMKAQAQSEEARAVIDSIEDENFLSSIKEALILKREGKKLSEEQLLLIETVTSHMGGRAIKDEEQLLAAITEASEAMEAAQKIHNGESILPQTNSEYQDEENDAEFARSILDSIDDANAYLEKSLKNEEDKYSSNKKIWDKFIENEDVQQFLKLKQSFVEAGTESVYLSFLNKFSSKAFVGQTETETDDISLSDRINALQNQGLSPSKNNDVAEAESNQGENMRTSFNIVQPNPIEENEARGLFYKKQDTIRQLVLDIVDSFVSLNEYIINNTDFS